MSAYEIVSADAHVLEPTDIWDEWLPKQHRDKAPKLVKDADGGDAWLFAGATDPDPIGLVSTPGMAWDDFRWTGITYDMARPGCYNGAERLKDMDLDGVDAEILFPPQRTIGHFLGDEDDEFVMAGIEAYNNFLFDEFMAPDPTRLVGMAQIPSLGTDVAIETMRKAKARGFKGVVISMWPSGGDSISDADDPFWQAAADEHMPVCIHINLISRRARQKQRAAAAKASAAGGAKGEKGIYGGKQAKANAKAVAGL
ncbi:MAG: amidohydrolase family protein, partial [Acidimicrobiia bacterium]|nr:amidohydrolase family protein [Acidimicrobiia bacterium]